MQENLWLMK